nr:MAG TPA: hypothetical protein [Caudoviricetes sp.]
MSKNVSKEEIKEVVETSKEVVDTAVEAAEQTDHHVKECFKRRNQGSCRNF